MLYLGSNNSSQTLNLNLENLTSVGYAYIGYSSDTNTPSSNNQLKLTAFGTEFSSGYLYVGQNGSYNTISLLLNTLPNNAEWVSSSYAYIGWSSISSNNSILVDGPGNTFTPYLGLHVGENGSSA